MASEVRVNFAFNEALTEGTPDVRTNLVFNEALTEGSPFVRSNLAYVEALTEWYNTVRTVFILREALVPVAPEAFMSENPFPGFGSDVIPPAQSALPGLAFSVHKRPTFNTMISRAVSGREIRNALMEYPRWEYELTYEFLEDRTGASSSLKTIVGFFLARHGSYDTWLFKDPDDYSVDAGLMGTADGVTTQFYFRRTMGEFAEIVGQVDNVKTITLFANGVEINPVDYTVTMPNYVVFGSAPADGVVITATFEFYFVCRFMEDEMDFEKFMDKLWELQKCSFISVIQ